MSGSRLQPASLGTADSAAGMQAAALRAARLHLGIHRLQERWAQRTRFVILETGFGSGISFLSGWRAWRDDPARPDRLHHIAIAPQPYADADLAQLHASVPELATLAAELRAALPPLVPGFHRLALDEGRVILTLIYGAGDLATSLRQIEAAVDAFYLDGFPGVEGQGGWQVEGLMRLNRLAAPDATASATPGTPQMSAALARAGFLCEVRPGDGGCLFARYAPRAPQRARPVPPARRAVVIGAGVAGSAACERLAARGWQITLIEQHGGPAQEASGNLAGIVMPLLSRDDNLASRLARAAYLYALRNWQRLQASVAGEACGVLQLARDAEHARQQRDTVAEFGYPPDYVRWLAAEEAAQLTGNAHSHGGWLFPGGGSLTPSSLCKAMLEACGNRLQRRFSHSAASLRRMDDVWQVLDAGGAVLAQAPVVVVANGTNAIAFPQTQELPLTAIRGQVSHVPAALLPVPAVVLCGDGYVTRPVDGICCVGASYDVDADPMLRLASHEENLARLAQVLPGALPEMPMAGRVGFRCVSPDRLPVVGALPDAAAPIAGSRLRDVPRLPGVYGLLAYGSRGLIWAPLAAELLASTLEGEPLPVEQELASALDPARFALKAWRRTGAAPQTSDNDAQDT